MNRTSGDLLPEDRPLTHTTHTLVSWVRKYFFSLQNLVHRTTLIWMSIKTNKQDLNMLVLVLSWYLLYFLWKKHSLLSVNVMSVIIPSFCNLQEVRSQNLVFQKLVSRKSSRIWNFFFLKVQLNCSWSFKNSFLVPRPGYAGGGRESVTGRGNHTTHQELHVLCRDTTYAYSSAVLHMACSTCAAFSMCVCVCVFLSWGARAR